MLFRQKKWKQEILWTLGIGVASFLVTAYDSGWDGPVIIHSLAHFYQFPPPIFFIFCFVLLLCWDMILLSLELLAEQSTMAGGKKIRQSLAGLAIAGLLVSIDYFARLYRFYFVAPSSPLRHHFLLNFSFLILLTLFPYLILAGRFWLWNSARKKAGIKKLPAEN